MACNLSSGFSLACRDNIGGIKSVYILSGSVSSVTATDGLISTITGDGTFYEFNLQRSQGQFTETVNPSLENGTIFYSQAVDIVMSKMQSSIRNQVKVLAQSPDLKIIVQTENGNDDFTGQYFYVGRYRGATLTAGSGVSGTAPGDANQYTLTFEATEPYPAEEIDSTDGDITNALSGITVA